MSLTKRKTETLGMLVLVVMTTVAGLASRTEGAAQREFKLPEDAKAILDNADKIEVIAIDSRKEGTFHGYKVLGSTTINKEERQKLATAILDGIDHFKGRTVYVWYPRFGMRAWHKEKTVDLIFCFHASQVMVHRNPNATVVQCDAIVPTAGNAETLFATLLKQAKVPTAPKAD